MKETTTAAPRMSDACADLVREVYAFARAMRREHVMVSPSAIEALADRLADRAERDAAAAAPQSPGSGVRSSTGTIR